MSSEFSNMKKLPYIPPMSPPPIDSLPEEADYEIPDYDITGLSQKFCDEETSITHQPLENTLDEFDVTIDSNLNSLKDSNSFNKDDAFQKIETIMRGNSEEESSSSITIPPLDCEGQSLNDCNISDLENDICDNPIEEFDFPTDSKIVSNDENFKCNSESDRLSPAPNSSCQKEYDNDKLENGKDPTSHLDRTLKSNRESVHFNETKEERVNEIEENVLNTKDSNCEIQSEYESNKFTPNFSELNLVYDDGGGGRVDCVKSEENVKECSTTNKISDHVENGEFSSFVCGSKIDNPVADDFGDFVSKNKIEEKDVEIFELPKEAKDEKDNEDFGDFKSDTHFEVNEIGKSDSSEVQHNTKGENFRKGSSDMDENFQNDDFGNFVTGNEGKSTDQSDEESFGNFTSNLNEINNEKMDDDFGNFVGNKENSPVINFGNGTLEKRLSDKGNSANNTNDSGNLVDEKEQGFNTDEDNDDFGDFYSTNVVEEAQSEVKICQENYHDEYLDPSISYDSPSKFNKYSSANDAELKGDKKEGLQLEFSDDENETVDKVDDDDEFSHTDDNTLLDPDLKENKFHGYFVRWLPKGSRSITSGSFLSFSKLNELIGGTVIWFHATNVESCSALQFSWTNSRINKLYLSSLNVDTRNILLGHRSKWISTIPIFAQALSFSPLTPLKPSTNSVSWNIEESSVNVQPNIPYRPGEDALKNSSAKDVQVSDIKNIPPAKFDWNSSGLTNPLNMPEKELIFSLEKDFTSATTAQEFKSSTSVIEEALKKVNYSNSSLSSTQSTSQNNNTTQRLPPKVQQIVNSIPDLNFMQSKVLAFPIGQTPDFFS
ncbi:UNVERIFIED_CONTAM: hypothetical protein RMT77_017956 [Armadillidium vulgare]